MIMTFASALRQNCLNKRVQNILANPKKGRNPRIILRWERAARNQLGLSSTETIDWSAINWAELLKVLLPILLMILSLF